MHRHLSHSAPCGVQSRHNAVRDHCAVVAVVAALCGLNAKFLSCSRTTAVLQAGLYNTQPCQNGVEPPALCINSKGLIVEYLRVLLHSYACARSVINEAN